MITIHKIAAASGLFLIFSNAAGAGNLLFNDSFESGDRSATANGFTWGRSSPNAVVVKDHPRTGKYSLRCTYAGKESGLDSTCEQHFSLGDKYTELWIRWSLRIPDNYYHRDDSPSNNKLLVMWSKDYKDMGNRQSLYYWASAAAPGSSTMSYVPTRGNHLGTGPVIVNVPQDRGKWIEYTLHWKRASGPEKDDGVVQLWAQKDESPTTLVFDDHKVKNWGPDFGKDPNYNFLDQGYLMGWSNSGYDSETSFYIDDVTFSSSPLIIAPKQPQSIAVQ